MLKNVENGIYKEFLYCVIQNIVNSLKLYKSKSVLILSILIINLSGLCFYLCVFYLSSCLHLLRNKL